MTAYGRDRCPIDSTYDLVVAFSGWDHWMSVMLTLAISQRGSAKTFFHRRSAVYRLAHILQFGTIVKKKGFVQFCIQLLGTEITTALNRH